jgi:excisionase family DNA binding protein
VPWLLTVAQVCQLLNLSRSTVDRLAKRGELPGRLKLGGQVRYDAGTLRTWIDAGKSAPGGPRSSA